MSSIVCLHFATSQNHVVVHQLHTMITSQVLAVQFEILYIPAYKIQMLICTAEGYGEFNAIYIIQVVRPAVFLNEIHSFT